VRRLHLSSSCWSAVAIVTALLAAGAPAFHEWLGAYELANQAKHLAETMTRARTEAIRTNYRVSVCKSPDQRQCVDAGGWEQGLLVFVDENENGRIDAGERILEIDGRPSRGITITANRPVDDYVSYTSLGSARHAERRAADGYVHPLPPWPARDARRARQQRTRCARSARAPSVPEPRRRAHRTCAPARRRSHSGKEPASRAQNAIVIRSGQFAARLRARDRLRPFALSAR
jgi:type IV fimbrial biogenesis protein FimT